MAINLDVHGNTQPLEAAVQAAVNRIRRTPIKITVDDKGATQPLGNMKRGADEFTKSMEAANARIIAFGASMAIINGVADSFKAMVRNMVEVEKSLADINVVMGLNAQSLEKFSDGLFKVAKETGAAFKIAADAATEYARQGLNVEESLKRTKDALILTRLTGMDSAEAVKSLTAAMNTYGHQIKDTTQLVSKFAAVDVKFAVSAEDFADAISRTGAAAKGAGVDIDELIGLVTAAQQQTARGGKVIGNSFKTIFTRIGRTDTLNQLENLGIAVRDIEGRTLGAKRILSDLANTFDTLSEAQKAQIAQTVGGVFQINVLKAVLGDAAKQNGILANATQISANATDEAITKNEQLRNTMAAMATETGLAIKQVSAQAGEIALGPGIEKVLNTVKAIAENISGSLGDGEGAGNEFAKGLLRGIGNVITGPGLVVLTTVFIKLFGQAFKFTKDSLGSLIGITNEAQKQKAIQTSLVTLFGQNAALSKEMLRTDISRTEKEKIILSLLKAQVAEANILNNVSKQAAATLYTKGYGANLTPRKGRAYGHIPNFAHPEREQAAKGGYSAGNIREMNMPGEGPIIYNSSETVKNFKGMNQPAIMPPQSSKAGKNYQEAFSDIHGFDPYAAGGYIPNFIKPSIKLKDRPDITTRKQAEEAGYSGAAISSRFGKTKASKSSDLNKSRFKHINPLGEKYVVLTASEGPDSVAGSYFVGNKNMKRGRAQQYPSAFKNLKNVAPAKVDVPFYSLDAKDKELNSGKNSPFKNTIYDGLKKSGGELIGKILNDLGFSSKVKKREVLTDRDVSAMGGNVFEGVIASVLSDENFSEYKSRGETARIDLPKDDDLYKLFGVKGGKLGAEAKITSRKDNIKDAAVKFYDMIMPGASQGYIPNFSKVKWSIDKSKGQYGLTGSHMELMHFVDYLEKVGVDPKKLDVLKTRIKKIQSNVSKKRTEFKQNNVPGFGRSGARYYDQLRAISEGSYLDTKGAFIKDLGKHVKDFNRGGGMFARSLNAGKGFIPNFAADPLADAIGRERDAGIPVSQIRVGTHPALMNKGNPIGLGVTNTKDEPNGLRDVFGANGFVPNYANPITSPLEWIKDTNFYKQMQAGSSAIGDHEKLVEDANKNKKELLKREKRLKSLLDRNNKIIQDRNASGLQKLRLEGRSNKLQQALNETVARRTAAEQQASSRASGGTGLGGFAGRTSGRMGRMFSGNTGMTMMIGAPMAAGFLQSGGAGQTGAGGAMYAAGGALQGAASGGMMASMIAPFFGPAAPLVIGVGALGGAISGMISASKENTAALNEQIRDQNAALIQSENNTLATAIMSASKNNKSMFGVGSLEKLFSGYTPKEGETFGESMYNLSVPEATRKKLETGQIEDLKEEDFYKTNVPQVKQLIKTNKIDALVATGLEDINSIYNQQLEVFNNKIAGLASRLPGGKNFESGGNNTAGIREELDKLIKTRDALRQDISDRQSKGLRDILSQKPEELQKLYEESSVAKERTQQFLNRSGNVKQILRSIISGSEDVNFDLGKDGLKTFNKATVSGKEIINALDNINPAQLELLFSRVAELYLNQEKALKDQNEAVILQLNLQKAMIQAQQKSAEAQLDIKAKYVDMSNSLKTEKQLMGSLISEERKARIDFIGAINKAEEAYELGTNQAKSEFKKGLISDVSSGQNAGLTQALKQKLFEDLDDAALKDKTTVDLTNELNSKSAEELLSILKEIGVNEDQANKIVENRSLLYENQITLLGKQKTLSESQANSELTINNILAKRRELLEDMNQSIQNFNRDSSFISERSSLDKRIADAGRSVGGYTSKQKQLQIDRADLEGRITRDIVRKSEGAKMGILQQAAKDLEIGGFTDKEIDKIIKMPGKEVDINSILESRFKEAGGKNEITQLQNLLGGGNALLSDEEFQQTVGFGMLGTGETRQEMKQRLEELKILDQQRLGVNEDLNKKIKDINDSLIQQNVLKEKGVQAAESELSAREKNDRYMRGQSVDIGGQVDDRSAISRGMSYSFAEMRDQAQYMHYEIGKRIPNAFADGLAGALTEAINGAASLEDALRGAALAFLKELQSALMKKMVYNIVGSMGGGMSGALGFSNGGNVRKYSKGGSVPAMVSDGEYVMNKEAVRRYGGSFMHTLNAGGEVPKYANGGWVDSGLSGAFASPPSAYSPPEFSMLPPRSFKNRFLDFMSDENNMKLFQQEYQRAQAEAFAPTTALADAFRNPPPLKTSEIFAPTSSLAEAFKNPPPLKSPEIFTEPTSEFSVLPPRTFKDRMMDFFNDSDNMKLFEEQYSLSKKKAAGVTAFSFKNQPSAQQKMQRATSPFNWKQNKDGTVDFGSTPFEMPIRRATTISDIEGSRKPEMDNWNPFSLIDSKKVQGPPAVDKNADILKSVEKQLIKQRSSEMKQKGADISEVKRKYNYLLNKVRNPNENVFDHAIERIKPGGAVSGKDQFKLMKELYGIGEKPLPSWMIKGSSDYLLPPFIRNKPIDTDYKRLGFKYGGKVKKFAEGGNVPEDGSALAANFGGARAYQSGRKYQSRNMSAMFYAGQTQTMGLEEDRAELQKQISEEERKRNEEAQKRAQKKAERRQLLTSLVSSIALGAISSGMSAVTNDMALSGTFGGKAQSKAILRQKGIPSSSVDYLLKHNPGMDEVHAQMLLTNAKSGLIPMQNLNHLMPAGSPFTAKDLLGKPFYLGGQVKKYANGGYISGKSGIDQIPAMLSEGEYVIKASSARQIGKSTLDRINAGKFYDGGPVDQSPLGESSSSMGGGNTNNINISINMERGKASSEEKDENQSSNNSKDASKDEADNAAMAERIKQQVMAVLAEEQRPGGLLDN